MTRFPYGFPTTYSRPFAGGYHWPRCTNSQPGSYGHECGKPATCIGTNHETGLDAVFCDDCAMNGTEGRRYANLRPLGLPPVVPGAWVRVEDPASFYRGRAARVLSVADFPKSPVATVEIKTDGGAITFAARTDQLRVYA